MKSIFNIVLTVLVLIPSSYAQKIQIKEAQKQLKAGNPEAALAILSPIEYLISNANAEDKVNFYYVQGTALVKQTNNHVGASKNITKAISALSDLIQVESESNNYKFTSEAITTLHKIKDNLLISAKDDFSNSNFIASSAKFYESYLIDKSDTLQLYNAAMSYKNTDDIDATLKCFEELKTINYSGNVAYYVAYNKTLLRDESFETVEERDAKIKSGTHMRPSAKIRSKKGQIYKNIALIYVQKGFKEKALKAIDLAKKYDGFDQSLSLVEAELYLATKDYETFDQLAKLILELDPKSTELAFDFGLKCEKELYYEGAEYYYKKAIAINPIFIDSYIKLSKLLIDKSNFVDSKIKNLAVSDANKIMIEELKLQKEQILKSVPAYLQKIVSIDPFNNNAKQLVAGISMTSNMKSKAFASGE